MRRSKALLVVLCCLIFGVLVPSLAYAFSSENFIRRGRHIVDDWGVFRTRANGADGFLGITSTGFDPIITREGLGDNADAAWRLGEEFARKYPKRSQRAEKIFYYVRDHVRYTSDSDQFGTGEYAQNADEVLETILADGVANGDCEDSAILAAVMFKGAGFRSAMVLMPGHVATLVYLPEYRKASRVLTLGGEAGWVWAEATGSTNPFGWAPESLMSEDMIASEVTAVQLATQDGGVDVVVTEGRAPESESKGVNVTGLFFFVVVAAFLWRVVGTKRDSTSGP
ncbi:MAG: transglutaminase domain-containing protein [Dehalococcoidia bacterium]